MLGLGRPKLRGPAPNPSMDLEQQGAPAKKWGRTGVDTITAASWLLTSRLRARLAHEHKVRPIPDAGLTLTEGA